MAMEEKEAVALVDKFHNLLLGLETATVATARHPLILCQTTKKD